MTEALNGKFVDCRALSEKLFECRSNGNNLTEILALAQS